MSGTLKKVYLGGVVGSFIGKCILWLGRSEPYDGEEIFVNIFLMPLTWPISVPGSFVAAWLKVPGFKIVRDPFGDVLRKNKD